MNSPISHDSALAQELVSEHRELLAAFGTLKKNVEAEDAAAFRESLLTFKGLLVAHLVKEAYKVYTYLRQQLKDREDLSAYHLVNAYKSEMAGIGDAALKFVETYSEAPDPMDFGEARTQLQHIGHLLGDRVRREESDLYPLYHTLKN